MVNFYIQHIIKNLKFNSLTNNLSVSTKAIHFLSKRKSGFLVRLMVFILFAVSCVNLSAQITQVGTVQSAYVAASQNITINKPSGVQIGDVMIINIVKYLNNNTTNPSLTGWTGIFSALGGNTYRIGGYFYRVVDGTEGTTFTISLSGGTSTTYAETALVAYTGVDLTQPFDAIGTITPRASSGQSITAATITTTTTNSLVLMLAFASSSNTTTRSYSTWTTATSPTLTELYDQMGTSTVSVGMATGTKTTVGATGAGSVSTSGNAYSGGVLLALRPQKQFRSLTSGNWNLNSTWQQSTNGGTTWETATSYPTNKDDLVTIQSTHTVTLAQAETVSSLTVNTGGSLDVNTFTLTGTGTLTATSGGNILVGGTSNFPSGFTTTTLNSGSTVNYDNAGSQTVAGLTYSNLTLSGSGIKTLQTGTTSIGGNLTLSGTASTTTVVGTTIGGNLNIGDGTTFTLANDYAFTVTGTTTIGAGNLIIGGWSGTKLFNGLVTINLGGTWNNSGNLAVTFRGGITNNGTFTVGSGTQTFDTNAQNLNGNIDLSGAATTFNANITNQGNLTLTSNVSGSGALINASTRTLNLAAYTNVSNLTNQGIMNISGSNAIGTAVANFTNTGTVNLNGSGYITGLTNNLGGIVNYINASQTIGTFNNSTSTSVLNISALITSASAINTLTAIVSGNTVNYSGAGAQTIMNTTYSNLILSGSGIKTFASTTTINGDFTLNTGVSANLGTGLIHTAGTLTLGSTGEPAGSWGGTGSSATFVNTTFFQPSTGILNVTTKKCTAGSWIGLISTDWNTASNWCDGTVPTASTNVIINSGGNQPVISAAAVCNNLTINTGATLTVSGTNTLTISGVWSNSGTFVASSGTVIYNGSAQTIGIGPYNNLTLSGSGAKTLQTGMTSITGNLTLSSTATTSAVVGLTIGGDVILGSGTTFNSGAFTHNVAGNWTNNGGTFTQGTGTVTFTGSTSAINGSVTSQTFNNIVLNKTAGQDLNVSGSTTTLNVGGTFTETLGDFNAPSTMTVTGDLTLTSGTFTAGASLTSSGNWINNGGTFTAGTGTVTFTGNTSAINGTATTQTFNNIIINKTSGQTLSVGGSTSTLAVGGNFTETQGNFTAPAIMTVTGNLTFNAGTFTPGTGLITLNGTTQSIGGTSSIIFNDLTFSNSGTKTFLKATTINGDFAVNTGVVANLGTGFNHTVAGYLILGSVSQTNNGTWGSTTATTATYHNDTFFAATTGIITLSTPPSITCPPVVTTFANPLTGLITAYPFNETSGTVAYDVIGNQNANFVNSPVWDATGHSSGDVALHSVTSDYIQLPAGIVSSLTGNFSISTWVYWTGGNAWQRIFDFGNSSTTGYMFLTPSSGTYPRFAITNTNGSGEQIITGTSAMSTNTWHHIVVTLSGNIGTLYIDGASVATNSNMTIHPSSLGNTANNWIGKSQYADPYFNGKIDEFRIYNVALTTAQVIALRDATSCTASSDYGSGLGVPTVTNGSGTVTATNNASYPLPLGANTITWTAKDALNHTSSCTQSVTAITSPPTFTGTLADQLVANTTYTLSGGLPAGGTYSGTGVTGTNFNASVAGAGTFTITYSYNYTYADGTSCTKTATNTINVYAPTVIVSPTTLTSFTYPFGAGPSGEKTFTVSGTYLNGNIIITPPAHYEISTGSGVSFVATSPITLAISGGSVSTTTIYVRLKAGLAQASYNLDSIEVASTGTTTQNVVCSGNVTVGPVITIAGTLTQFTYTYALGPSAQQTFNVSGTNLLGNVTITPPSDFEISTDGTTYYSTARTITASGTLASTPVYVRMKAGLGIGSRTQNVVVSSSYAPSQNVSCTGTVSQAATIFNPISLLSTFIYAVGTGPSGQQTFTVSGTTLSAGITITPPANFEISTTSGSGFQTGVIVLPQTGGVINTTNIYVRMVSGLGVNDYGPSNIVLSTAGATSKSVSCSGSVVNTPTILVSKSTLTGFGYQAAQGGPSSEQTFTVSGASLTNNITITPPASYYEISITSGSGFQTTPITLTQSSGRVNPTIIYVRLKSGSSAGDYTGTITASAGTPSKSIALVGKVFASPLITASLNPSGGSYCLGSTINLISTGADIQNRYWQGPNSYYSVLPSPTLTTNATAALSGTYTVTGNVTVGGNLVTNGDFEAGNTSFGSGYIYRDSTYVSNCWQQQPLACEGNYTVVAIPHNVHTGFNSIPDHTTTGKMQLVVNGASVAGVVVWSQSVPVISGASYQFTYWEQTVNTDNSNPSQLQLYVNGIAAGPVYSATTPNGNWSQFLYNASAGSNSVLNLELINQSTAAGGNDFALDDIVFQQILSATASVDVSVAASLPVSVTIAASANPVTQGATVTLTATPVNGGTTPAYVWYKNNAIVAGVTGSTYSYAPANGDIIYCILSSSITCTTGNPATSNTVTMTVNPANNYWRGTTSTDWGTPSNWTAGTIPLAGDNVVYASTTNGYGSNALKDLQVDGDRTIGSLINATDKSLIIPPNKSLTVNNTITTNGNNPNLIYIQSSSGLANGSLIFHNAQNAPVYATVEMYSMAYKGDSVIYNGIKYTYNWQYFGIPTNTVTASPTLDGSYVRRWVESGTTISNHWVSVNNSFILQPGIGYELTQDNTKTIVFQGQLVNWDITSPQLPYTRSIPPALYPGQNILANPFTAALDITKVVFGSDIQQSVWLYSTGSIGKWAGGSQYTVVVSSGIVGLGTTTQIPSMQGMLVQFMPGDTISSANSWVKFPYSATVKNLEPQRVKGTNSSSSDIVGLKIDVKSLNSSDKMWLFTGQSYTRNFDNGFDGFKKLGSALSPQLYAIESDGNYQIDCIDDMNNTLLGFQAGQDTEYIMTFTHQNIASKYAGIYLVDLVENKTIDITADSTTYTFNAASTDKSTQRFCIFTRNNDQSVSESTKIKIFSGNGIIIAQNSSELSGDLFIFDIAGRTIKKVLLVPNGLTTIFGLVPGAYIGKAVTSLEKVSKRLIVR